MQVVRDADSDDAPGDQDADSNRKRTVHSRDGSCNEGQVSHAFLSLGSMQCAAVDIGSCCITVVSVAAKGCGHGQQGSMHACAMQDLLDSVCAGTVLGQAVYFTGETCILVWLSGTVLNCLCVLPVLCAML